jgi:hypothetical protein
MPQMSQRLLDAHPQQKVELPAHGLEDGLYRVWYRNVCAGFVIHKGGLTHCSPILRRRISYWMQHAKRIGNG